MRQFVSFVDCSCKGSSTIFSSRTTKEEPREQSVQNSTRPTVELTVENALIAGFDLQTLTKTELIVMIKRIFEEAEAVSVEEDTEPNKKIDPIMEGIVYDHKTRLKDRITPENENDSLVTPTKQQEPSVTAVAAMSKTKEEKPPEKPAEHKPRKRPTKKERELLRRFKRA